MSHPQPKGYKRYVVKRLSIIINGVKNLQNRKKVILDLSERVRNYIEIKQISDSELAIYKGKKVNYKVLSRKDKIIYMMCKSLEFLELRYSKNENDIYLSVHSNLKQIVWCAKLDNLYKLRDALIIIGAIANKVEQDTFLSNFSDKRSRKFTKVNQEPIIWKSKPVNLARLINYLSKTTYDGKNYYIDKSLKWVKTCTIFIKAKNERFERELLKSLLTNSKNNKTTKWIDNFVAVFNK